MIHLNTNVAIALLNGRLQQVSKHCDAAHDAGVAMGSSIIDDHELMYGAATSLAVGRYDAIDICTRYT